jgi:hypothetical protein
MINITGNELKHMSGPPIGLVGEAIKIYLLAGGKFYFKVTGAGKGYLTGHDDEGQDLHIEFTDIRLIVG